MIDDASQKERSQLNNELSAKISTARTWSDLQGLLQVHAQDINYVNVSLAAHRLTKLTLPSRQGSDGHMHGVHPPHAADHGLHAAMQHGGGSALMAGTSSTTGAADHAAFNSMMDQLASLIISHSTWFQSHHFAQVAQGMSHAGYMDAAFWKSLEVACTRKLMSFNMEQLTTVMVAMGEQSIHACSLTWASDVASHAASDKTWNAQHAMLCRG